MSSDIPCSQCGAGIDKVTNFVDGKLECPSCGAMQTEAQVAAIDLSTLPRARVIALCVGIACLIFGISACIYGEFTIRGTRSTGSSGGGMYRLGTSASYWFGASMLSFSVLCFFVYWATRKKWYTFAQYPKWARSIVMVFGLLAGTGLLGAIILQGDPIVWAVCAIPGLLLIPPAMTAAARLWKRRR